MFIFFDLSVLNKKYVYGSIFSEVRDGKLHKLSICGIRSFGPNSEDVQIVKFTTPVTLILGENGSGKTTIIESLKYACTGELPSGSNGGQGFVNYPKLNSSAFTKGCIKLEIADFKGNSAVITKAVKV